MLQSYHYGPLLDKAGEGEGAGDGPKPLSEEDVGRIVNSAVTAQLKRALGPAVTEAIGGLKLNEQIAEAIGKLQPVKVDTPKDVDDDPDKPGRITTKELQRQLTGLQEKLDASEKKAQDLDRQRIEIEQRSRFDAAKNAFRAGVQPKVKPELLDPFVDYLAHVKGVLKVDDTGNPTLTVKRAAYKGAPMTDEDLPLAEAIPLLLATDEAKPFLPAPGGHQEDSLKGRQQTAVRFNQANGADNEGSPVAATLAAFEKLGIDPSALGG